MKQDVCGLGAHRTQLKPTLDPISAGRRRRYGRLARVLLGLCLGLSEGRALEILSQPESIVLRLGGQAQLSVLAEGVPPVAYQWQFMWTDLPGATRATLSFTNAQPLQAGGYRVIVSDSSGSRTSATAVVTVDCVTGWTSSGPFAMDIAGVEALSSSDFCAVALRKDGSAVSLIGAMVPADITNAVSVKAGANHALALRADGTVAAWGNNDAGQSEVPARLADVRGLGAGYSYSLAVRADGSVVSWGGLSPAELRAPLSLSDVVACSATPGQSIGLKADGTVVAWGLEKFGGTNVLSGLSNVVAIASGYRHHLALKADGTVAGWGENWYGQLDLPPGLKDVVAIDASAGFNLALKADGSAVVWGEDAPPVPFPAPRWNDIAASFDKCFGLVANGLPHVTIQSWDRSVLPGQSVTLTVKVVGNQPMAYQWQFNGRDIPDATCDSMTLTALTPGQTGIYALIATNQLGAITSRMVTLTVTGPANHAPVLQLPPDRIINLHSELVVSNRAFDADLPADELSYRLVEAPAGATVDHQGTIRWTPNPAEAPSRYLITTVVTDNGAPPRSATNQFLVHVLDWTASGRVGILGGPLSFGPASQQYFLLAPATWADAEMTGQAMGGHLVTVNSQEEHRALGANFSCYDAVSRPLWIGFSDPQPWLGTPYESHSVYWVSGEPITFSCWSTTCAWPSHSAFSPGEVGRFEMCASDADHEWVVAKGTQVLCSVVEIAKNHAPLLPSLPPQSIHAESELVVTNTATELDLPPNSLRYELINPPPGATIDSRGVIHWTPSRLQGPGSNTLVTVVTDNGVPNLSATNSFTVVVLPFQPIYLTPLALLDARFQLQVDGPLGWAYILQASPDLKGWTDLQTNVPTYMPWSFFDPGPGGASQQFYRVRVSPVSSGAPGG